jgi:hypothetical protein
LLVIVDLASWLYLSNSDPFPPAFANTKGGLILIGVHTVKDEGLSADVIKRIAPFGKTLINVSQYKDILGHWVYPSLQKLDIEWILSSKESGHGIVMIEIGNQDSLWRPFVITRAVKDNGKASSVFFAYAERSLDRSAPMGVHQLHLLLRDGLRVGASSLEPTALTIQGCVCNAIRCSGCDPTQMAPRPKPVIRPASKPASSMVEVEMDAIALLKQRAANATRIGSVSRQAGFYISCYFKSTDGDSRLVFIPKNKSRSPSRKSA